MLPRFPKTFLAALLAGVLLAPCATGSTSPAAPPLAQSWAQKDLITADDDWSSVPAIVGRRGDGLAAVAGTDPRSIVADGAGSPLQVLANRSNPGFLSAGGVAEFDGLADPTVALQGSSTAAAPHLVAHLATGGLSGIAIQFAVRDVDPSADDARQQIALQFRVGSSGDFANVPDAFVADATDAGSATRVTPVSAVLPPVADDRPLVEVRILTVNAAGADEWVGIDDLVVTGTPIAPADGDGDGVPDGSDNCTGTANADQADLDGDRAGDACDADDDGDGVLDSDDAFPADATESRDADADGVGDNADNCPGAANPGQADVDGDGQGDACDPDNDQDGVPDGSDNCPSEANPGQLDTDADGGGDACDSDDDGDGVADGDDGFPLDPAEWADMDGDGVGDNRDNCARTPNPGQADGDGDGLGDACDAPLASGSCRATGAGAFGSTVQKAFALAVQRNRSGHLAGVVLFVDRSTRTAVKSTAITSIACMGAEATITGRARIDHAGAYAFEVRVADVGRSGKLDTFSITLSNGYAAAGTLAKGNIVVSERR